MEKWKRIGLLIGVFSGLTGIYVYTRSGVYAAMLAIFFIGWILYRFSSGDRIITTLSWTMNPFMSGIVGFLAGLTYFEYRGAAFGDLMMFSVATGLLGTASGMFVFKYWNIGD